MTAHSHRRRQLTSAALTLLLVATFAPAASLAAHPSAWAETADGPRSLTSTAQLKRLELRTARIEAKVELMERMAARFRQAMKCISWLPVTEYGDPDHDYGFHYDELDGTGPDFRPALSVQTGRTRPDYMFLAYSQRPKCQSSPTRPGTPGSPGTADPAWVAPPAAASKVAKANAGKHTRRLDSATRTDMRLAQLELALEDLERRSERLLAMSERFDEWESCLTWVGVTEYGDPDGKYGFMYDRPGGRGYMPGLALDVSEWDDPDYTLLAFAGRDRPFTARDCKNEPGESVD